MPRTRLLIPLALAVAALVLPAAASASFTARILPTGEPNLVGSEDGDAVTISSAGPFLSHSLTARLVADGNLGEDRIFGGPLRDHITGSGGDDLADGGALGDQVFLGRGRRLTRPPSRS